MQDERKSRAGLRALASGALLLCALAALLLAVPVTRARYSGLIGAGADARVAAFNVRVTAPEGLLGDDELAGGVNDLVFYTTGAVQSYTFTVHNESEVALRCTLAAGGDDMPLYSLDVATFDLDIGQSREVTLTLYGSDDGTKETVQALELVFTLEQID